MRIWIDLTNSPHVLFFRPLIDLMRREGAEVSVTARDFAQTVELCDRFGIEHARIGRHAGARATHKAMAMGSRSAALYLWARGRRFDRAIAHASTDSPLVARLLGIPQTTVFDYEFADVQHHLNCRLASRVVVPDRIPARRLRRFGAAGKIRRYPGLKEEYYLSDVEPDPAVLESLGINRDRVLTVVRTPPEVSLYHQFRAEPFRVICDRIASRPDEIVAVVLPRTREQRAEFEALGASNVIVPAHAVDTQSLIAFADLVIGGGGTMNREAVALGTPAITTFAGRLGAVDESLVAEGRLGRMGDPGAVRFEKKPREAQRMRRHPELLLGYLV